MDSIRSSIENLKSLSSKSREEEFTTLIKFIDQTLGQAYKLSGDERANFLVTSFLNIRDYMQGEVLTESLSNSIVDVVLSVYDSHTKSAVPSADIQPSVDETSDFKKNLLEDSQERISLERE